MQPKFNFRYGRQDCPTSPLTDVERPLPSGHLDTAGLFSFFYQEFHMNAAETVAIMGGGHTLGGSTGFSGWRGFWSGSESQ